MKNIKLMAFSVSVFTIIYSAYDVNIFAGNKIDYEVSIYEDYPFGYQLQTNLFDAEELNVLDSDYNHVFNSAIGVKVLENDTPKEIIAYSAAPGVELKPNSIYTPVDTSSYFNWFKEYYDKSYEPKQDTTLVNRKLTWILKNTYPEKSLTQLKEDANLSETPALLDVIKATQGAIWNSAYDLEVDFEYKSNVNRHFVKSKNADNVEQLYNYFIAKSSEKSGIMTNAEIIFRDFDSFEIVNNDAGLRMKGDYAYYGPFTFRNTPGVIDADDDIELTILDDHDNSVSIIDHTFLAKTHFKINDSFYLQIPKEETNISDIKVAAKGLKEDVLVDKDAVILKYQENAKQSPASNFHPGNSVPVVALTKVLKDFYFEDEITIPINMQAEYPDTQSFTSAKSYSDVAENNNSSYKSDDNYIPLPINAITSISTDNVDLRVVNDSEKENDLESENSLDDLSNPAADNSGVANTSRSVNNFTINNLAEDNSSIIERSTVADNLTATDTSVGNTESINSPRDENNSNNIADIEIEQTKVNPETGEKSSLNLFIVFTVYLIGLVFIYNNKFIFKKFINKA